MLVNCEYCGQPTAPNAKTCPACGCKIYRTSEFTKVISWVLLFALILFIVGMIKAMG